MPTKLLGVWAELRLLGGEVVGISHADRDAVIAGVEIDSRLLAQVLIAPGGEAEQAAEGRDRTGLEASQLLHLFSRGKPQALDVAGPADGFARQLAIGWQHDHHKT